MPASINLISRAKRQAHRAMGTPGPARKLGSLLFAVTALASLPLAAQAADVAGGQALALDRAKGNCQACHTIKGGDVPSSVGRELVGIKKRFPDRAELVAILTDEPSRNALAPMPPFGRNLILTPAEIEKIIDFLYTL